MSERQKPKQYTYKETFSGVSFAQIEPSQSVYLFSAHSSTGSASITIPAQEVQAFRESLLGVLAVVSPGFGWKDPKAPGSPSFGSGLTGSKELFNAIREKNKGRKADEKIWTSLDMMYSITEQGILFEVIDKRGIQLAALLLKSSGYEGETSTGYGRVETGNSLVDTIFALSGRSPLTLHIGKELSVESSDYVGTIEKTFPAPLKWLRMSLQLQASSMLPSQSIEMAPIDLYNITRALHLRAGDQSMKVLMVDGLYPRVSIEPWDWSMITTGAPFSGTTQQLQLIEYDAITRFQDLIPFVQKISIRMTGEALPSFWNLSGEHFSVTLGMANFQQTNWTKGLMLNQALPRLDKPIDEMGNVVSTSDHHSALTHGIQMGAYSINIDGTSFRRDFARGADMPSLKYRSGQERVAYELVGEGKVHVASTIEPNGRRVLMTAIQKPFVLGLEDDAVSKLQLAINNRPERNYSTVSESKKDFQYSIPVFQPRLAILPNGATRLPQCSCTYFLKYGDKKICAHVQALYIQYLQTCKTKDPATIQLDDTLLVKISEDSPSEEVHTLRLQNKRVIEEWGSFFELNNQTCRRQVLAFNQIDQARNCFHQRIETLEKQGFVQAE
ncbi:MAG: hypothetical protein CL916_10480 [Deltaproteobacteria bacterium]|nr:hypothetical protein [Deltaproteobacteria bacterium]